MGQAAAVAAATTTPGRCGRRSRSPRCSAFVLDAVRTARLLERRAGCRFADLQWSELAGLDLLVEDLLRHRERMGLRFRVRFGDQEAVEGVVGFCHALGNAGSGMDASGLGAENDVQAVVVVVIPLPARGGVFEMGPRIGDEVRVQHRAIALPPHR